MTKLLVIAATLLAGLIATQAVPVAFLHGIASGDPLPDSVIIWTRVTPRIAPETITALYDDLYYDGVFTSRGSLEDVQYNVTWMVSERNDLSDPVQTGVYTTDAFRDFTVKVDVTGLESSLRYYYGFMVEGDDSSLYAEPAAFSPVGTFRLAPPEGEELESLKYAIFTCANWGWGYFNAYDYASQLDLDFFIHVGDYIYEYGPHVYPNEREAVRFAPFPYGLQPPHEMVLLEDYRARHAHYRMDAGLQALTASAPMIANWDDHEHTNDPWKDGAQNHNAENEEGDWTTRKSWSTRAYHEWMPTRSGEFGAEDYIGQKLWRKFPMGDLATVYSLEQRVSAKTQQFPDDMSSISSMIYATVGDLEPEQWNATVRSRLEEIKQISDDIRNDPSRKMIGDEQMKFIQDGIAAQKTQWTLVGQTTDVNDLIADFRGAIDAKKESEPEIGELWEEVFFNLTHEGDYTYTSYSSSPHFISKLGQSFPVEDSMRPRARVDLASGEYKIITWFDPWGAYTVDRERFLQTLANGSGNAVVYGGDTHGAYAAYLRTEDGTKVGAEFNTPGVTSPSWERSRPMYPLELLSEASIVGDPNQNHFMADFRHKGFILVNLDKDMHHSDFVWVSHGSTNYAVQCDRAFNMPATSTSGVADDNVAANGNPSSWVTPTECTELPPPRRYVNGVRNTDNGVPSNYVNIITSSF